MADTKQRHVQTARERLGWIARNRYYHHSVAGLARKLIPARSRVLQLAADMGQVIGAVDRPSRAVAVDERADYVALGAERFPGVEFQVGDPETFRTSEKFDFVILTDALSAVSDVQAVFERAHEALADDGRLILSYYNYLWDPLLRIAERFGAKMPQRELNWLPLSAVESLFELTGFKPVTRGHLLLIPRDIPILSAVVNRFLAPLPLVRGMCLVQYVVARPDRERSAKQPKVSVIVPCRNESGTIGQVIDRMPKLGSGTEIVFVEGHSKDDTLAECLRIQATHPEMEIQVHVQEGTGKGDAVRKGFAEATGDILLILDADLTVPPEDLPKLVEPIASGKADFTNGTRLIYPMEREAMRFLNLLANRTFSLLFSYLVGQRLTDTLCGTKALSRPAYDRIVANRAYFGDFDPFGDFDLLLGAARLNMKIMEVPVRYAARQYGETNISRFRHGLLLLQMSWVAMRKLKFAR